MNIRFIQYLFFIKLRDRTFKTKSMAMKEEKKAFIKTTQHNYVNIQENMCKSESILRDETVIYDCLSPPQTNDLKQELNKMFTANTIMTKLVPFLDSLEKYDSISSLPFLSSTSMSPLNISANLCNETAAEKKVQIPNENISPILANHRVLKGKSSLVKNKKMRSLSDMKFIPAPISEAVYFETEDL